MSNITFQVSMPTDEGFLGRECNGRRCGRYFRVHGDSIKATMHCPYCGTQFSNNELHTKEQVRYLQRAAEEQALEYMHGEIV
jgi:sarcosine oxidase delta subunit